MKIDNKSGKHLLELVMIYIRFNKNSNKYIVKGFAMNHNHHLVDLIDT